MLQPKDLAVLDNMSPEDLEASYKWASFARMGQSVHKGVTLIANNKFQATVHAPFHCCPGA